MVQLRMNIAGNANANGGGGQPGGANGGLVPVNQHTVNALGGDGNHFTEGDDYLAVVEEFTRVTGTMFKDDSLQKAVVKNVWRNKTVPGVLMSDERKEHFAKAFGVSVEKIEGWYTEFLIENPGYTVRGERRCRRTHPRTALQKELKGNTLKVPTNITTMIKNSMNSTFGLSRVAMIAGNAGRPVGQRRTAVDVANVQVANAMLEIGGRNNDTAFNGSLENR